MAEFKSSNKARFWLHILYPENMIYGWEEEIADLVEVPYAYCIHDKDKSGHISLEFPEGDRKKHVHAITAWTTGGQTKKRAWETVESLAKPGRVCSLEPRPSSNIEHSYAYLIHDTENAQKKGKHLYSPEERITGNSFDIDRFIVLDSDEKLKMAEELMDFAVAGGYRNAKAYYVAFKDHFVGPHWFEVYKANANAINQICRGNWQEKKEKKEQLQAEFAHAECASCRDRSVTGFWPMVDGEKAWYCDEHKEAVLAVLVACGKQTEEYFIEQMGK